MLSSERKDVLNAKKYTAADDRKVTDEYDKTKSRPWSGSSKDYLQVVRKVVTSHYPELKPVNKPSHEQHQDYRNNRARLVYQKGDKELLICPPNLMEQPHTYCFTVNGEEKRLVDTSSQRNLQAAALDAMQVVSAAL